MKYTWNEVYLRSVDYNGESVGTSCLKTYEVFTKNAVKLFFCIVTAIK
jgi:hypothetical protein